MKYFLDKDKAVKALNEGFVVACGEKHRAFIEGLAEEMIALGMANGKRWSYDLIMAADKVSFEFEMFEKNIIAKDKIDSLVEGLKLFFSDEDIERLKVKNKNTEPHPQMYMQGLGKFEQLITETIAEEDMTCQQPRAFDYFKAFPVHKGVQDKSCSVWGEAGLGLDQYSVNNMRYYKEEGELCYPIEAICRKYHYLGQMLARQEALLQWVEKIKATMKPDTDYFVRGLMASIIYKLANSSDADNIIHDIQSVTGVTESFMTHNQVSSSLKRWANSKEGKKKLADLEESFKKKKEDGK